MQIRPPAFAPVSAALAAHTRRDIVRRAITAEEGVLELAGHYPMSFAAIQKHVAVLERAGLITKQRVGRRRVVRTNLEALLVARRLLDQYEELWRARIHPLNDLISQTARATATVKTKESQRRPLPLSARIPRSSPLARRSNSCDRGRALATAARTA